MNEEGLLACWYALASLVCFFGLHSDNFVFLKRISKEERAERGVLLVHLLASWVVILCPSYLYENRMTVLQDIVEPNLLTVGIGILLLLLAGLLIPYTFHLENEKNRLGATISFVLSIAVLVFFSLLIVVVIPLEVAQCPCADGYYGEDCQGSCFFNNVICSGHGSCGDNGCVCDERFQGEFCNSCTNQFLYESDCTSCRDGYSLLFDCTRCETGRDPATDCQQCIEGYDLNATGASCSECLPFYFKPSALPSRESYNEFLRVGSDQCTKCPEKDGKVCNGHGECQHYRSFSNDGKELKEDANGRCVCEDGFFGDLCDRVPGFDMENTESICNGHGSPTALYEQTEIFQTYTGLVCTCEEGFFPTESSEETACSEEHNDLGNTIACVYGYQLIDGQCQPCPGGGFLQACNAGRGGGFCDDTGTCQCSLNYDPLGNGGYAGFDCKSCANNFYQNSQADDPLRCAPCPSALGPSVEQACGGKGYCITQGRINHWKEGLGTDTDSDSYAAYAALVDTVIDLGELDNYIGQCLCRSGFSNILGGSCN